MSVLGDIDDLDRDGTAGGFKRHLFIPGVVLGAAEVLVIALPLWTMFDLGDVDRTTLLRIVIPVLVGIQLVWLFPLMAWLTPIQRAIGLRRRGKRLPKDLANIAYRATHRVPLRALMLRTSLWIIAALAVGGFFVQYSDWEPRQISEFASLTGLHAFSINVIRAVWYAGILSVVRNRLFAKSKPLRRFVDGYYGRLVLVALVVCGGTLAAVSAFLYYFLPISHEQYLQISTYYPSALAVGMVVWALIARRSTKRLEAYLISQSGGTQTANTSATSVYRSSQALPYRLATVSLSIWIGVVAFGAWVARSRLGFEFDDTFLMVGITLVIAIGASIYESLWHRETMRPLLAHLTVRYRLPVRGIRPSLSLRTKLLLSFGGVVLFACGLALFWGFIQYKSLVTDFVSKQGNWGLAWMQSRVAATAAASDEPPTSSLVRKSLAGIGSGEAAPDSSAVYYYLSDDRNAEVMALGGGSLGAPRLPWYTVAQMKLDYEDDLEIVAASLAGRHGPLVVEWKGAEYDLGYVAVMYPTYQGRGESIQRPLKELLIFFLVLFGACAGIVLLTVAQFVKPIRKLEQRADGMARGELAEPVSSGGEGDEIGRLTFALEEMRRALREKLRSTEEVNLDLERAVQRRTADLAKKNRELAETLDKLTRAQDQLVRAEKMASIGQLVAGIAHEINNPVNAIVNTVGPLEEAIGHIDSKDLELRQEAASDVRDMVRVVQRGAQRTKAIVQALHNYSRTDDESVVEFDLNRSIDDSLELLRHLLRQNIEVVRDYGKVGRIRGHAGQLNQVFMNLLTNAAQAVAGRDDATIRIVTEQDDADDVVIRVSDNGSGIPASVLPRIFDPFFTTKDVGEGSGLGLSIVHGLVERHGGTIEVDSVPDEGTTFTVTLPRGGAADGSSSAKHRIVSST
jgi:signal transduction histidine kinase